MSDATLVGRERGDASPPSPELSARGLPRITRHAAFRRTMGLFATGVTVITARMNGSVHGMTANAVTSVSLDPLLVLAAINRRASMSNIIQQAGEFAINILSERQEELSRHFAGAKIRPPPASLRFEADSDDGAPYIVDTLAAIRCRVARVLDGGDHVILLGRVVHFRDGPPASPLVYFGDRYCSVRDLPAPSTANSAADFFDPSADGSKRARLAWRKSGTLIRRY